MDSNECQFQEVLRDFIDKVIKACSAHLDLLAQLTELKELGELLKQQMLSEVMVTSSGKDDPVITDVHHDFDSKTASTMVSNSVNDIVVAEANSDAADLLCDQASAVAHANFFDVIDVPETSLPHVGTATRSLLKSDRNSQEESDVNLVEDKAKPCTPSPDKEPTSEDKVSKEFGIHECGKRKVSRIKKTVSKNAWKKKGKKRKLDDVCFSSTSSTDESRQDSSRSAEVGKSCSSNVQKENLRPCVVRLSRLPQNTIGKCLVAGGGSSHVSSDAEMEKVYKMKMRSFKDLSLYSAKSRSSRRRKSKSESEFSALHSGCDSPSDADNIEQCESYDEESMAKKKLDFYYDQYVCCEELQSEVESELQQNDLNIYRNTSKRISSEVAKPTSTSEVAKIGRLNLNDDKLSTVNCVAEDDTLSDENLEERNGVNPASHYENFNDIAWNSNSEVKSASNASDDSDDSELMPSTRRKNYGRLYSSSEEESLSSKKDGMKRKNIRAIINDCKVAPETKDALRIEEERRIRIASKQKEYNDILLPDTEGTEIVICGKASRVVLDYDQCSKKAIVEVDPLLVKEMKPHQIEGVRFMWDCCYESVERIKADSGGGCILSHCMGLGKTFQVIALLHTLTRYKEVTNTHCSLIVVPKNTLLNWKNEFVRWQKGLDFQLPVFEMSHLRTEKTRLEYITDWYQSGGVLIISYEQFRRLSSGICIKKKSTKESIARALVNPGPDVVVCDEGHVLKNHSTSLSKAMNKLATRRRIVLTGTPLQNNLVEYHCMVSFVKPNLLGNFREFKNRFANPILNGLLADSTLNDVKLMKRRAHVLHELLDGCVQRKDYRSLCQYLPPKHEYVISVRLSAVQRDLYKNYLETVSKEEKLARRILIDFHCLNRIWSHPWLLFMHKMREDSKQADLWTESSEESFSDSSNYDESDTSNDLRKRKSSTSDFMINDCENEVVMWWSNLVNEESKYDVSLSGKVILFLSIIRKCEDIGDKIILFTQSLLVLDYIEEILTSESSLYDGNSGVPSASELGWQYGRDYFRLDGGTDVRTRMRYIKAFNDPSNYRARLFLISSKAGGLGINLIGANRVIIFDTSWNPAHDVQAIFRSYRFGQVKPVFIYRLLSQGTMEEKVYQRQVNKQGLALRVCDEQQLDRHFTSADLNELYSFKPDIWNSSEVRPTPVLPKDRLLADLLRAYPEWIVRYHEHDSLLENKIDEGLTEEERKSAWEEYEAEKRGCTISNGNIPSNPPAPYHQVLRLIQPRGIPIITLNQLRLARQLSYE